MLAWSVNGAAFCPLSMARLSRRAFTTLCYSADGRSVLAGGMSKFVCIYHVREQILMKKFEVSQNLSLDAMEVSTGVPTWEPHPTPRSSCPHRARVGGVGGCSRWWCLPGVPEPEEDDGIWQLGTYRPGHGG